MEEKRKNERKYEKSEERRKERRQKESFYVENPMLQHVSETTFAGEDRTNLVHWDIKKTLQ